MFRFTPRTIPNHIFIVGCGGTGSRLVPLLTQFIASISKDKNPRGWLDSPTIFLADDDVIETKNLQRQNFIAADVGKNKATVLAQRYGKAYGVNVIPITRRIGPDTTWYSELPIKPQFSNALVIMCVDTAQARRDIIKTVHDFHTVNSVGQGAFFIDAGNEDNFGQVRFFNQLIAVGGNEVFDKELPPLSPIVEDLPGIPMDHAYYDSLVDMPGQGSCADLDQTLAINAIMAAEIMGIVQNYFYVKPMTYHQISISLDGARSTSYNTARELLRLGQQLPTVFSRSIHRSASPFNVRDSLQRFINKTQKIMKQIQDAAKAPVVQPALPAEKSLVADVVEKVKKARSRRKVAEEVTKEEVAVSALILPQVPTRSIEDLNEI